jgi:hypothetical protein
MNSADKTNKILSLMEKDDSVDAPADTLRWVKNLYLSRSDASQPSLIRRIVAVLIDEIQPGKAAFGERSASASHARQMLFSAEDAVIDLRIKEKGKKLSITGQIIGEGFESAEVRVYNDAQRYTVSATGLAEFELYNILKGVYSVSITTPENEIAIERIDLT